MHCRIAAEIRQFTLVTFKESTATDRMEQDGLELPMTSSLDGAASTSFTLEAPTMASQETSSPTSNNTNPSLPKRRKMKVEEVMEIEKRPTFIAPAAPRANPPNRGSRAFRIYYQGSQPVENRTPVASVPLERAATLPENKKMADKWVALAVHFLKVGDMRTGVLYMYHALKLYRDHVPALLNLGIINDRMGKPYEAYIYFMRALAFGEEDRVSH